MDLDTLYQGIILDHYRSPKHAGLRERFHAEVHHVNPTCGDEVTMRVLLSEGDNPRVVDISYDALGCSISQASASIMAELMVGESVEHGLALHAEFLQLMQSRGTLEPNETVLGDAVAFVGVAKFPARIKCALLPWMAWKDATSTALADLAAQPLRENQHVRN